MATGLPDDVGTTGIMQLSDSEFRLIRELVYSRFGINLTEAKRSLVVGRLQSILRAQGFSTFKEYYRFLVADESGKALETFINRITTNHTFFYREHSHFDYFRKNLLPQLCADLKRQNSRDIRIWCAGCSSGEEPYMLIMLMIDYLGSEYGLWDGGILATDISSRVLDRARAGVYAAENVQNVPSFAKHHFLKTGENEFVLSEKIKREVTFRRFNLMNEDYPFKKPFHVIFCRNVMIYFDRETRTRLLNQFHRHLLPDGHLFIGHSESIGRQQDLFTYIIPGIYKKK